eukprot:20094-Heterococcus_DN1.PRE.1
MHLHTTVPHRPEHKLCQDVQRAIRTKVLVACDKHTAHPQHAASLAVVAVFQMQQLAAAAVYGKDEQYSLGISEVCTRAAADVEPPQQ